MKLSQQKWFIIVGVISVVFLGWALFWRTPPSLPPEIPRHLPPDSAIHIFMTEKIDYSLDFSQILAARRIERLQQIAEDHPEHREEALAAADSIKARMKREAKMNGEI
ncbi:MAG: hypothetical protein CL946_13680 [Ectothiorhodospiraceae bacterium]|nr:hypothetical protein [Ectothiorhodospiraceae bacterium]